MSAATVLTGRRVDSDLFFAGDAPTRPEPGDYAGPLRDGTYVVCDPNGECYSLRKHTIEDHADGTITARPSIVSPFEKGYHGWLEHGVWRPT